MLRFKKHLRNLAQNIHFFVFVKISSKLKIILSKIKSFEMSLNNLKCDQSTRNFTLIN